jgi:hypothetical protein
VEFTCRLLREEASWSERGAATCDPLWISKALVGDPGGLLEAGGILDGVGGDGWTASAHSET